MKTRTTILLAISLAVYCSNALTQVMDNPGFKALPRPINYATPLAPGKGAKAVIVYGKNAPWTKAAAEAVRKAVEDWSGVKLELADDRTVTSDETWLLNDAYVKAPLIAIGNAQDNRVMHAMATRYLVQSNHTWPGGDRYIVRTVVEPFVADVNYIILESSNQAGMDGAVARFAGLLKGLPKEKGRIPLIRIVSAVKDAWRVDKPNWTVPPEYTGLDRSASEIARTAKGDPPRLYEMGLEFTWPALAYTLGGTAVDETPGVTVDMPPETWRAIAAHMLRGCRAAGNRAHYPMDHYGAKSMVQTMRGLFQTGLLTDKEVNEFENFMTLSAAYPNEYTYDHIGNGCGYLDPFAGRHYAALVLLTANLLDYVKTHCNLDDRTRKEVERRWAGTRKTTAALVGSYRDSCDTWELGESTMLIYYAMLYQGFTDNIRNGLLKLSADMYILTTDNIPRPWDSGCYAGLDSYIGAEPGMMLSGWHGKGLVSAAAFYYDDPQYRWFNAQGKWPGHFTGRFSSVAAPLQYIHWDFTGAMAEPVRYRGARSLPYDRVMYGVLTDPSVRKRTRADSPLILPPVSYEKAVDRVAFRDGFDPRDAYLFMATSQGPFPGFLQSNALARYTDLSEVWLFHNTTGGLWSRNMLLISNGKPYEPRAACSLEAQADLGDVSAVSSTDHGVSGVDWTRTVVHWRGHYFAVLDRVEANADDDFNLACRWRTPHAAELKDGVWSAMAPSLGVMRIQNTDGLRQSSEYWENDGATRPYVLTQFKRTKLSKGESDSLQNLIFVSGAGRNDEFTARRAGPGAMLVGGRTASGEHLALIGTGGRMPLVDFQTDAAIYDVAGNTLGLAGAMSLRATVGGRMQPVLTAEAPVNLRLDCQSGRGEIEVPGDKPVNVKIGAADSIAYAPGKRAVTLAQAGALPSPAVAVAALWAASKPPEAQKTATAEEPSPFRAIPGDLPLTRPSKRLSCVTLSSKPASAQPLADLTDGMYSGNLAGYVPTWATTDGLEITITLPEPTKVSRLRLVGVLDNNPKRFGEKMYGPNDFTFSLVLSNDGFQNDVRTVSRPATGFEESVTWPLRYFGLVRLPTFRIDVNDTARQIKLLPRAASKDKPSLSACELEVYAQEPADEMTVQAAVADLDGKGDGRLVVATSQHEVAAYGPDGLRLWHKQIGGDPLEMLCVDLDSDGRSEALVYDTTETLYRFNGDGTERPRCDFRPPQFDMVAKRKEYQPDEGHILSMAAWAPDGKKTEIALWSGVWYRVDRDGKILWTSRRGAKAAGRVPNLFPGETDVMGTVAEHLELWSSRLDQDGNYVKLTARKLAGSTNCGPLVRGFGWVQAVNTAQHKGVLAANGGSVNWFPLATLLPGGSAGGWGFDTCGVTVTAALAEDIDGDGVPEVFLARQDGFVNVFKLADGSSVGLLNTGEPILGLAMLKGKDGKPRLAVGAKFGVHLFGTDLKEIGGHKLPAPAAGFAGPGGKDKNRVYVVDVAGNVTVLTIK